MKSVASVLNFTLENLDLDWQYRSEISTGTGGARKNVWSRSARRGNLKRSTAAPPSLDRNEGSNEGSDGDPEESDEAAIVFRILIKPGKAKNEVEVVIRWLKGTQSVLFESFCGMLKRQIIQGVAR